MLFDLHQRLKVAKFLSYRAFVASLSEDSSDLMMASSGGCVDIIWIASRRLDGKYEGLPKFGSPLPFGITLGVLFDAGPMVVGDGISPTEWGTMLWLAKTE